MRIPNVRLTNLIVFVEASRALIVLGGAALMEVVATLVHLHVLAIPSTHKGDLALVAFEALGNAALRAVSVEDYRVSHDVFLDEVRGVIQDVLMVGLPLDFLLECRLELLISWRLILLLSLGCEYVDDLFQLHVLCHPHHEGLDSRK